MTQARIAVPLAALLLLTACGGGGNDSRSGDPDNRPPVVDAGLPSREEQAGQTILLLGSASDPDTTDTFTVQWRQVLGAGQTAVTINNANQPVASFFAPIEAAGETLIFEITAEDINGASSSDRVSIELLPAEGESVPVISVPLPSPQANEGETVTLTAQATDPDGQITSYTWDLIASDPPLGVVEVVLEGNGDATPEATFVAPPVDTATVLTFSLTVEDDATPPNEDVEQTTVTILPLPDQAQAAQLYALRGDGLIVRFVSSAQSPQSYVADANFGAFDPGDAGSSVIVNGGMDLSTDGRLIIGDDEDANGIREVCTLANRLNDGDYTPALDRQFDFETYEADSNGDLTVPEGRTESYASVVYAKERGFVIAIDDFAGGSQDARALHVYGAAVTGDRPFNDNEGNRQLYADIPLPGTARDLAYDEANDRLYLTLPTAGIAVYNNFLAEVENERALRDNPDEVAGGTVALDALIEVRNASATRPVNYHGVAYDAVSDRLLVSDIGRAFDQTNPTGDADGAVYILSDAASIASGGNDVVPDRVITAAGAPDSGTTLGDPVDLALNGRDLAVADRAAGVVYIYQDVFATAANRIEAPVDSLGALGVQRIALQARDVPPPHVNDLSPDNALAATGELLVVRTVTVTDEGGASERFVRLERLDAALAATSRPALQYSIADGRDLKAMSVALNGDVYVATGTQSGGSGTPVIDPYNPGSTRVVVVNSAAENRLSQASAEGLNVLRDRRFSLGGAGNGGDRGAQDARASLVIDDYGVIVYADAGDDPGPTPPGDDPQPGLALYSVCANGTRIGSFLNTPRTPTDLDYDGTTGDLYLSFDDGTVGIYRAFGDFLARVVRGEAASPASLTRVTPTRVGGTGSRVKVAGDFSAIEYLQGLDQLVLASRGTVGDGSDGKLFVLGRSNGFAASELIGGNVDVNAEISGPNTALGDPVDLAFDSANIFVAEQQNGRVLRFNGIGATTGGDLLPNADTPVTGITDIVPLPEYIGGGR